MAHLPCPFCGSNSHSPVEGSTFRWAQIECNECGARSGETRRSGPHNELTDSDVAGAYMEWDTRTPAPAGNPPAQADNP